MHRDRLLTKIRNVNEGNFVDLALQVYQYQQKYNPILSRWIDLIGGCRHPQIIENCAFLPIAMWKYQMIKTGDWISSLVFESSGTGGQKSKGHVRDLQEYLDHSENAFWNHLGLESEDVILYALLPSYHQQSQSSLLHMIDRIASGTEFRGYFVDNLKDLAGSIQRDIDRGGRVVLFGVSYALLDLAHVSSIEGVFDVFYTGGMKGRADEIVESRLRELFEASWSEAHLHGEYGMTELSSQAYSGHESLYYTPDSRMRLLVSDRDDPLSFTLSGKGIAVVLDLGNLDSCAFVQTQDLIDLREDGRFRILGRTDHSQMRGCNQMYTEK